MGSRPDLGALTGRQQPIAYADNRNRVEVAGLSDEFWKYHEDTCSQDGVFSDDPCIFLIQCEDEDQRSGLPIGTTYQNWLTAF